MLKAIWFWIRLVLLWTIFLLLSWLFMIICCTVDDIFVLVGILICAACLLVSHCSTSLSLYSVYLALLFAGCFPLLWLSHWSSSLSLCSIYWFLSSLPSSSPVLANVRSLVQFFNITSFFFKSKDYRWFLPTELSCSQSEVPWARARNDRRKQGLNFEVGWRNYC